MRFQFGVNLSDEDYLAYNQFVMLKSYYGKKQLLRYRIVLAVISCVPLLISLLGYDGSVSEKIIGMIPALILAVGIQLLLPSAFSFSIKRVLKLQKKTGKSGYSAAAQLEFYNDTFSETTDQGKTERPYSALERISILEGKYVYLHINSVMAYILPKSVFASEAQYQEFIGFITEKCPVTDRY